jgi:hypothetical protein
MTPSAIGRGAQLREGQTGQMLTSELADFITVAGREIAGAPQPC